MKPCSRSTTAFPSPPRPAAACTPPPGSIWTLPELVVEEEHACKPSITNQTCQTDPRGYRWVPTPNPCNIPERQTIQLRKHQRSGSGWTGTYLEAPTACAVNDAALWRWSLASTTHQLAHPPLTQPPRPLTLTHTGTCRREERGRGCYMPPTPSHRTHPSHLEGLSSCMPLSLPPSLQHRSDDRTTTNALKLLCVPPQTHPTPLHHGRDSWITSKQETHDG